MELIALLTILFAIFLPSQQNEIVRNSTIVTEERTFIMIKPDGVQRGLVGEVLKRYEAKGLKMIALKMFQPSHELVKKHYEDIKDEPFIQDVFDYMALGPVVATAWQGYRAVLVGRQLVGTSPAFKSLPGTIRFDYSLSDVQNVVHSSSCVEAADREIKLWFNDTEIYPWIQANEKFLRAFV